MPNLFAWIALFGWPAVVLAVYALRRGRASPARTTAWMMVLPAMFLPANLVYDPPLVPALDKHRLSFLAIFVALQAFHRRDLLQAAPWHQFPRWVMALLLLGIAQTTRTNPDSLRYGPVLLPGLTTWDALSDSVALVLDVYLPFAVGQRVFRTERDLRDLLEVLTIGGLIYLPLALLEVRLSPQFHRLVYGYFPSDFLQAVRAGGFRPIVFMNHGLSVAMFAFGCLAAALGLVRARIPLPRWSPATRTWALAVLVLACKSMGAIVYAAAALLLRLMGSTRAVTRLVLLLAAVVVLYPTTRSSGTFPARALVDMSAKASPLRAASLAFRFQQEDELLQRAMKRPWYGWGGYDRAHVWTRWGQDLSVTDGYWIITLGNNGFVGFCGFFALLIVPLVRFARRRRGMPASAEILVGTLALMVAVFTVDLLPNARSDYLPVAYAGALFTLSETLARSARIGSTRRRRAVPDDTVRLAGGSSEPPRPAA